MPPEAAFKNIDLLAPQEKVDLMGKAEVSGNNHSSKAGNLIHEAKYINNIKKSNKRMKEELINAL